MTEHFYDCNRATIERATFQGQRVIYARIYIATIGSGGSWRAKEFKDWESLREATEWVYENLAKLAIDTPPTISV